MSNKIGVSVEAGIDISKVVGGFNKIGQEAAKVNKIQVSPVSDKAVSNATQLFETLKKIRPELSRRLNVSGQSGVSSFSQIDWSKTGYSPQAIKQMQGFMQQGAAGGGGGSGGFGSMAAGVTQAGLRAAGPAGGVAAGALGTGMASGAGAGLMGLMGGMLALGVGKLVSGVMEKVDQAENNAIAYVVWWFGGGNQGVRQEVEHYVRRGRTAGDPVHKNGQRLRAQLQEPDRRTE
jgi:hypothetical protein